MRGVTSVLAGTVRTRDIGGTATTTEFADAICRAMEAPAR
jgi:isocitrate/isopropylmalate dehydrogenase